MPTMNVSLTPELIKIVKAKVKSGRYSNASEVIREAIRNQDASQELIYEMKLETLRKALEPGIQQALRGEVVPLNLKKLLQKLDSER